MERFVSEQVHLATRVCLCVWESGSASFVLFSLHQRYVLKLQ